MQSLKRQHRSVHFAAAILAVMILPAPSLHAQATEAGITRQIQNLRSVPDDKRPAATKQIALDIRTLPAGPHKLMLADALCHLSTEGDPGAVTLQAVADTLTQSLTESPVAVGKSGLPPMPYMDVARLVRYEGVTTDFKNPLYDQAMKILVADDIDVSKADFTLRDMHNKKVTLSDFRGKVVLVNFWATWCPPCRKEMPNLDAIDAYFKPQGLVVLSISNEDSPTVYKYITATGYRPIVLTDPGSKVNKQFHVEGIPHTFVFDRNGKLVAEAIDMRTQRQFLQMLDKAGLDVSKH